MSVLAVGGYLFRARPLALKVKYHKKCYKKFTKVLLGAKNPYDSSKESAEEQSES